MRNLIFVLQSIVLFVYTGLNDKDSTEVKMDFWEISLEVDTLKEIMIKVRSIDDELKIITPISVDIYDKIIEPEAKGIYRHGSSIIETYLKQKSICKIKATYEGDRQTYISQFYFDNDKLIYIVKTVKEFNPPKWEIGSVVAKEATIEYLFFDNKLIKIKNIGMEKISNEAQLKLEASSYMKLSK